MFKTLKKNKKYILIVPIILLILAIIYTSINTKKPAETKSLDNENTNGVYYNITETHVNLLSNNGKIANTYKIDFLKPELLQRAKVYGGSFKKFEQEMSYRNHFWMDLIFIEYNIDKNLSNKEKYCKLRNLTGNCYFLKNDCPDECVNEETE